MDKLSCSRVGDCAMNISPRVGGLKPRQQGHITGGAVSVMRRMINILSNCSELSQMSSPCGCLLEVALPQVSQERDYSARAFKRP
jgi:hypothetical protein